MKISTVKPTQIVENSQTLQSAIRQLQTGEIQQVNIPIASIQDLLEISQHVQNISATQIENISNSNVTVHLHFDDHPETQQAFSALNSVLKPQRLLTDAERAELGITPAEAVVGGAVIGGVGGVGIGLLVQSLRSTVGTFTNPIVGTVASVLVGVALGAAGGAVFTKADDIGLTFKVGPASIGVTAKQTSP